MAEKTLTAPLALIKVTGWDGQQHTIGKMRNIRVTENIRRGRVVGIGEITPSELPALEWTGTCNVGQYAIKLDTTILKALSRNFSSTADFVKHILFNEGIDIAILKKAKNGTEIVEQTFTTIKGAELTSEGLDISEGQISGRDGTFEHKNPVLYA